MDIPINENISVEDAAKALLQDLDIYGIIGLLKKDWVGDELLYDIANLKAALERK